MLKIIHAADLHLDSPFEGLSAAEAAQRRQEQRGLLLRIAELAEEKQADLVLLAGDLFDSGSPYPETEESLCRALAQISAPVFISPGNHDCYQPRSRWERLSLPDNVQVFKEPSLRCVELPQLSARVWGAGFVDRACPPLLRDFHVEKQEGVLDILCIHGEVGMPNSQYNPISEAELAASGMDYAALGHIHSYSDLRRVGPCFYAWPGCALGRGFDETGEKGLIYAECEAGNVHLEFIPLGGRRYEILELPGETEDFSAVPLPEGAERDTYRVILTGDCAAPPDIAALRRAFEGRVAHLQVRDRTRIRRDVWERSGEDSLRGLFLRSLRYDYENTESEHFRELLTYAARCGLAALDGAEEVGR